ETGRVRAREVVDVEVDLDAAVVPLDLDVDVEPGGVAVLRLDLFVVTVDARLGEAHGDQLGVVVVEHRTDVARLVLDFDVPFDVADGRARHEDELEVVAHGQHFRRGRLHGGRILGTLRAGSGVAASHQERQKG